MARRFFWTLFASGVLVRIACAAPGDTWNSATQFHAPVAGAPVVTKSHSADENPWQYGFRIARGYNDGKWGHMDAGPFKPFVVADELGPGVFGEADSGPDLNRWWVPFPPPAGQVHVGRIHFSEGPLEQGPEKYLAQQVHLLTDDDAPTTGIVSLRWVAPAEGIFSIQIALENRLDVPAEAQRDPFYHVLVNGVKLAEGLLEGFTATATHTYQNLALEAGDTVEICASTGSVTFPFGLLATDVTIEQMPDSATPTVLAELARRRETLAQGPEPVLEIADDHRWAASMRRAAEWIRKNLSESAVGLPFSFGYNGKEMFRSRYGGHPLPPGHLRGWKTRRTWQQLDENRVQKTITCHDLRTDLEVELQLVEYHDFPVVEWVVTFKNNGEQQTPILENIEALNIRLDADRWQLHHNAGSYPGAASFAPYTTSLDAGKLLQLSGFGGRPSNTHMPYFNLEQDDDGVILAVGWPGQWEANLLRESGRGLHLATGQQGTHLRLKPGESVRTPLVVLMFRAGGDWMDGQNVWRRWMIEHNLPRPGGKPIEPMLSGQTGYYMDWMYKATEENQKESIDLFLRRGIELDAWWMDTGWYTPMWEPVPDRFPRGIRPISDHAGQHDIRTILWFEPERVVPTSPLNTEHPEWVLHASTTDQGLLNLGNPQARQWITDRLHQVLIDNQIGIFRSDFNMDPLDHWRQNDARDRQGITENHYVTGYLAFWDALLERDPNLLIDSCASGGRRNDLETMRRSVPLWKCDYAVEPVGMQCQTYGLAMWLPYFGNCGGQIDKYVFRSNMYPAITKGAWEDRSPTRDVRDEKLDYQLLKKLIGQWRQVAPHYFGDFYPLTPFSLEESGAWMAWQFHSPETGEGFVQAFRRPGAPAEISLRLRGLEGPAKYEVLDFDGPPGRSESELQTGAHLMQQGLPVTAQESPAAAIFHYRLVQ